jgi:hypothetical protein
MRNSTAAHVPAVRTRRRVELGTLPKLRRSDSRLTTDCCARYSCTACAEVYLTPGSAANVIAADLSFSKSSETGKMDKCVRGG